MNLTFEHGHIWLVREDGWRYKLQGIQSLDWEFSYDDDPWYCRDPRIATRATRCVATVGPINDGLLDSLRVLNNELEGISLHIQTT